MSTIVRAIERLHAAVGTLAGMAIAVIIVTVVADVAMRALFNQPIPGASEFSIVMLVALIFLGQAAAQSSKQNFSVDFLRQSLPPRWRRGLDAATRLLALSAVGLLTWLTAMEAWGSFLRREASFGVIVFPIWPSRILIAFGLGLLCLQLLIDFLRACGLLSEPPIGGAEIDDGAD